MLKHTKSHLFLINDLSMKTFKNLMKPRSEHIFFEFRVYKRIEFTTINRRIVNLIK